jgi:hypothetical protein
VLWRRSKLALFSFLRRSMHRSPARDNSRRRRAVIECLECRRLLTGTPYYFAAISDYGTSGGVGSPKDQVSDMVSAWDGEGDALAAVVTAGDNRQQTGNGYATLLDNYYGEFVTEHRIYPVPGNHDWGNGDGYAYPNHEDGPGTGLHDYRDYFSWLYPTDSSPDYYDFVSGPVHFFMLSVSINEPGSYGPQSAQANWLRQQLSTSTSPWNIVVMHEPTKASVNAGTDWKDRHWSNPELQWPWKDWGVDAVIQGHNHFYEVDYTGGVAYFTIGLGGASQNSLGTHVAGYVYSYTNGEYGAQFIQADDTTISFSLRTTNGAGTYTTRNTYSLPERTQPVVNIRASDPNADESGDPGQFTVTRVGDLAGTLRVNFTVQTGTGYATPGSDYQALGSYVDIPAGQASAVINVTPFIDAAYESSEAVTVRLGSGSYTTHAVEATVTMTDDDRVMLVQPGSMWTYVDNGSDQGTDWRWNGFTGPTTTGLAHLGYSHTDYGSTPPDVENDEATVVSFGSSESSKFITTYFRNSFQVTDRTLYTNLTLQVRRDDGIAVYLNATNTNPNRVVLDNLADGAAYNISAPAAASDDGDVWQSFPNMTNYLVNGTNVFAAEVHQSSGSSSDISFDLQLSGDLPDITTSFSSGLLTITGTSRRDPIKAGFDGSNNVTLNGVAISPALSAASVTGISITGGDGADSIDLSGVSGAPFTGLNGHVTVYGGNGDDTITGSAFNDVLSPGPGNDSITGGEGQDTLLADSGTVEVNPDRLASIETLDARESSIVNLNGSANFSSTVNVANTARVNLTTGESKLLQTSALSIDTGATLDLADNDMIVQNGSVSAIRGFVTSGRLTCADPAYTTLAITLNNKGDGTKIKTQFDGVDVALTDLLVKYTWNGDANLDGLVNADDYFRIDSGYITQATGYYNGDFNYDGTINADDYFLIDSAYIGQTGPLRPNGLGGPFVGPLPEGQSRPPADTADTFGPNVLLDNPQFLQGLTIDLRDHATGGKTIQVTAVDQVITIDVYGVVVGTDPTKRQGLNSVTGGFLSTNIGLGAALGTLEAGASDYFDSNSDPGLQQDLDADGDLDVGGTDPSVFTGHWCARSASTRYASRGIQGSFLIGTLTFTVTELGQIGSQTQINFVNREGMAESALWMEDQAPLTSLKNGLSPDFHVGDAIILTR